jgi:hypothetical protein
MTLDAGGPEVLSEVARRAWAVEQAVAIRSSGSGGGRSALEMADDFLTYLETPFREADAKLLAAARAYDGTQAAGPLIGMLADALERMVRGG